jgi:alkaline phosphatase D
MRPVSSAVRRPSFASDPFTLGVAAGDPTPDGIVLWTRLAPEPLAGGGLTPEAIEVQWEIADDENMQRIVRRGTATARPELAHSVHVEVQGLPADRWYFYRFHAGEATSRVGRMRTAPALDAEPDRLRFAFASCQHYEHGYFTAYQHMLQDDLDLVVHLGDYIYEGAAATGKPRAHHGGELDSLADYRNRYALYRTDEHLQGAHARFPWLVTWDDHEFDNNCACDVSEEASVTTEQFLARRARAYQAYYEHMPLRAAQLPNGPHLQLYRACSFGRLATFQVLDTRQYRSDQPCGDGNKPPCDAVFSQNATVLGDAQEKWLTDSLGTSQAQWNVLAQQIMMARVDRAPGEKTAWSMDQWAGYDVPRKRLLSTIAEAQVSNPVVLTGDIHSNWVNDLKVDFDQPESPTVATEFVGTSITSGGDGAAKGKDVDRVLAENPFVKFLNAERGYVRCEVNARQWRADYRVVPKVTEPGSECLTRASFVIESGRAGAQPS